MAGINKKDWLTISKTYQVFSIDLLRMFNTALPSSVKLLVKVIYILYLCSSHCTHLPHPTLLFWDLYWDCLISVKWPMIFSTNSMLFSLYLIWTHRCPWNDFPDLYWHWTYLIPPSALIFSVACEVFPHLPLKCWCPLEVVFFSHNASPLPISLFLKLLKYA